MVSEHHLSERQAYRLAGLTSNSYRHPPTADQDTLVLHEEIVLIAHARALILVPTLSSTRILMVESSTKAWPVAGLRVDQPGCQRMRDCLLPATKDQKK
jgi:hypothetical protein